MNGPLKIEWDPVKEVYDIEGVLFSPMFFTQLSEKGLNIGQKFRLIKRDHGVVTIEELHD